MTKSDLIRIVSKKTDLTLVKSEMLVNIIFDSMIEALDKNHRVEIRGFGTFVNRYYKAYTGRNPRSGKVVYVDSKRAPFFKTGKDLKNLINLKR